MIQSKVHSITAVLVFLFGCAQSQSAPLPAGPMTSAAGGSKGGSMSQQQYAKPADDELRKKLLDRSIELLDHKGRTVWVKRERPE